MEAIDLRSKWDNITSFHNKKGYKALRISSDCIPELYLANDIEGSRCLLLYLPKKNEIKINGAEKDKLSLSYMPHKDLILIKLKDFDFLDLFNDLIISIYSKLKLTSNPSISSKEFVKTFYKWSEFFEESHNYKLSEEEVQGLFGELFVLDDYLRNPDSTDVNIILHSWKGLYGSKNDFEFDLKNIEVKTKKELKPYVKISSEFQLEKEYDKFLELLIVTVKIDLIKGQSIYDLLIQIVNQCREKSGDLSILYQALNQKGFTLENLKQYNNLRFIVLNTQLFDASNQEFPKLCISNIPDEVSGLKYNLRITKLNRFLIELKKY